VTEMTSPNVVNVSAVETAPDTEEHGHKPGAHGGIIVSLGRDSYHVEAIVEGGKLLLYTLGSDETRVLEIAAQKLVGYVKPNGATESVSITFEPQPQAGDAEGKTSLLTAPLPAEVQGQAFTVTVPNIVIAGERFRLGFTNEQPAEHAGDGMPAKVADEQERELYLTPGGLYTEEDIAANGNLTVSQKFKGVMAAHDLHPKTGDMLCPITFTKANPKFSWVVGGKTYEFCCPPCVDEFVATAKRDPAAIKEPADYIKR
jgi:YHS domain-containing protein